MHQSNITSKTKGWLFCILSLTMLVSFAANANGRASHNNQAKKAILIFGDSLSAGYGMIARESWASLLQQRLTNAALPYTVVNASVSGETTQGGLARFSSALAQTKPNIVLLALGTNDALRSQSMLSMKSNLQQMITQSKHMNAKILLMSVRMPPIFGKPFDAAFDQSFIALANDNEIPLVHRMMQHVSDNPALMQADWLHPNALGQPVILDNIWPSLKPLLN